MAEITVLNHVSLDGVVQSPAAPDEDPRDGFALGGWAASRMDHVMGEFLGKGMSGGGAALLFGRRTYTQFASFWPHQVDNPYTEVLDRQTKYVVSTTLSEPLGWQNSVLLPDVDAVAELKAAGRALTVMGSGVLIGSLRERDLVDRYVLMLHPVLLGSGHRLFTHGPAPADLSLVDSLATTTGVMILTYERAR